ncbi:MAG: glycosyltransferase [Acidimicrobiales bacterium]
MTIRAFAVGLPARDEEGHIAAAIQAVDDAARRTPVRVSLAVVADRCRDSTAHLARAAIERSSGIVTGVVVESDCGSAGAARDLACRTALARAATMEDPSHIWIATTDADSVVPLRWFELQALWSSRGADGCAGLVELDPASPVPAVVRTRWKAHVERLGSGFGHPHVHGANLSLRADLWVTAGGFSDLVAGEDHELWRRARALGGWLVGTDEIVVRTSAPRRPYPWGFSEFLAGLLPDGEEPIGATVDSTYSP